LNLLHLQEPTQNNSSKNNGHESGDLSSSVGRVLVVVVVVGVVVVVTVVSVSVRSVVSLGSSTLLNQNWRYQPGRNLEGAVVVGVSSVLELVLDALENLTAVDDERNVGSGVRSPGLVVPGSRVGNVQVGVLEVGVDTDDVSGLVGDKGENVGSDIVTSKSWESPVGTDGGDLGVVVVVVVVSGSVKGLVDGSSKKDGENLVLGSVGVVLVKGDEDEGVLGVRQRRL
jgi:hypothetical protein